MAYAGTPVGVDVPIPGRRQLRQPRPEDQDLPVGVDPIPPRTTEPTLPGTLLPGGRPRFTGGEGIWTPGELSYAAAHPWESASGEWQIAPQELRRRGLPVPTVAPRPEPLAEPVTPSTPTQPTGPVNWGVPASPPVAAPVAPPVAPPDDGLRSAYREQLLNLLKTNVNQADIRDPDLAPQAEAYARAADRQRQELRAAMAERLQTQGLGSSGALEQGITGGYEDLARETAGYNAQLVGEKLRGRRAMLVNALEQGGSLLNAEDQRQLTRELAGNQLDLERARLAQEGSLAGRSLALQERLGLGQLGLGAGRLGLERELGLGQLGLGAGRLGLERELGVGELGLRGELGRGELGLRGELGRGQLGLQGELGRGELGLRGELGRGELGLRGELGRGQLGLQGELGRGELGLRGELGRGELGLRGELGRGELGLRGELGRGQLGLGGRELDIRSNLGLGDIALRRELGLGGLNLGLLTALLSDQRVRDQLGLQAGIVQAALNREAF